MRVDKLRLCQKCIDAHNKIQEDIIAAHPDTLFDNDLNYTYQDPIPESECEFWVHRQLNEIVRYVETVGITEHIKRIVNNEKL